MKVYRVVRHGSEWHLISPSTGIAIGAASEKSVVLQWACLLAQKSGGEVHVYDDLALQDVYADANGVMQSVARE
ncbi:MAG: hypothetical protein GEV05_21865 [Betaproteobacteria bacterium]|nr:hypothetical protein [Betaproteobacteria bacterium]